MIGISALTLSLVKELEDLKLREGERNLREDEEEEDDDDDDGNTATTPLFMLQTFIFIFLPSF